MPQQARREVTDLTPQQEQSFRAWVQANGIKDVDHAQSRYDYRGYWKDVASKGSDQRKEYSDGPHFPDTYKQHGHPTFSVESKYSQGPNDGGKWNGETYVPQQSQSKPVGYDPNTGKAIYGWDPNSGKAIYADAQSDHAGPQGQSKLGGGYGVLADIGNATLRAGKRVVWNVTAPIHSPVETAKALIGLPAHAYQKVRDDITSALADLDSDDPRVKQAGLVKLGNVVSPLSGAITEAKKRIDAGEGPELVGDIASGVIGAKLPLPERLGLPKMGTLNATEDAALSYVSREGVPVSAPVMTGNDALKGLSQLAEKTTLGGSMIGKKATQATEQGLATLGDQLAAKAGRGNPTNMLTAGEEAASTMTGKIKQLAKDADTAYDELRKFQTIGVNIKAAKAQLRSIYDQLVRESKLAPPQGSTAKALVSLDRLMQADDVVPLSVADGALSEIKAALRKSGESEPWSKGTGVLSQTVKALDDEVVRTAKTTPGAYEALSKGRSATIAKYDVADVLDGLSTEPVQTVQKILGQGDRAVLQLREIRKHAPEAVGEMGRAYLDNLFTEAKASGGFGKADKLYAEWQKLGPATKRELFADALKKNPDYVSNLDQLFLASKKIAENVNQSGSGAMTANAIKAGFAGGALLNPKALILVGLYEMGGAATAAALRSPAIARVLTRGVRGPSLSPAAKSAYFAQVAKAFQSEGLPVPAFAQEAAPREVRR